MIPDDLISRLQAAFYRAGQDLSERVERSLARLPRSDTSGWYYIDAVAASLPDGRPQATIKAKNAAVGTGNPSLGPLPCLRSYTPVAGQRVLVRWVAGGRADGVIEG